MLAPSRLKPVPQEQCVQSVGPALAGKASGVTPQDWGCSHWPLPGWSRSHKNNACRQWDRL